jgi:hypothetical protein
MTVGLDGATVENVLGSGLLRCPVVGCGERLAPWGWARGRVVRAAGRLRPRRGRCRGCRRTQVLLPASVLLRRADAVTVIGAALLAKAGGAGHRRVAVLVGVPASTVRGWLRRITAVADRVLAVLAAAAAELGVDFLPPAPATGPVGAVVELVGALARAATLRLGGCGSWVPWRLAAVLTGGRLLCPGGPGLVAGQVISGNTNTLFAAGPSPGGVC